MLGSREVVDELADLMRRLVNPLCPFRMKTRSLLWEEGMEAIVAGCDWPRPRRGMERRTWDPGFHFTMCLTGTRILVTPPSSAVRVAWPGEMLL